MDYFNELLDSYTKLRKRTFKLVYINEEEAKEQGPSEEELAAARAAADKAIANPGESASNPLQLTDKLLIFKGAKDSGNINITGHAGSRVDAVVKGGVTVQAVYDRLVNALLEKPAKPGSVADAEKNILSAEEQAAQDREEAIEAERKNRVRLGGSYKKEYKDKMKAQGVPDNAALDREAQAWFDENKLDLLGGVDVEESLLRQSEIARQVGARLLVQMGGLDGVDKKFRGFVQNPQRWVIGGSQTSLEYKLKEGAVFTIGDDGKITKNELHPGLKQDATLANEFLLGFLTEDDTSYKCAELVRKVGVHAKDGKETLFLFGGQEEQREGVAITPNSLQKKALEAAREKCPDNEEELTANIDSRISKAQKNAVKGNIYEEIPELSILMNRAIAANSDEEKRAELGKINDILKKILIDEKLPVLKEIAEQATGDMSFDVDSWIENNELVEQVGILESKKALASWVLRETAMFSAFLRVLPFRPERTIHFALDPKTGDRKDNGFMFNTLAEAQACAKAVGESEVITTTPAEIIKGISSNTLSKRMKKELKDLDQNKEIYILPFGQKRMNGSGDTKAGELASNSILSDYLKYKKSNKVADGFFDTVESVLPTSSESISYMDSINKYAEEATARLSKTSVYKDTKGAPKVTTPGQVISFLGANVGRRFAMLGLDQDKSGFKELFFDGDKLRNTEDRVNRERIQEGIQRHTRFAYYRRDLRSKNPEKRKAVEETLLRSLLVAGLDKDDILQVKTTNDGSTKVWKHNEPFVKLVEAYKQGNVSMSINGTTCSFTMDIDGEPTVVARLQQAGAWSSSAESKSRQTRTSAFITKKATDHFAKVKTAKMGKKEVTTESILTEFLEGQRMLIETLLNQTRN